jgi:hypothetical protein
MAYGGPRIQLAESFRQVSLLIPHLGTLTKVSGDVQDYLLNFLSRPSIITTVFTADSESTEGYILREKLKIGHCEGFSEGSKKSRPRKKPQEIYVPLRPYPLIFLSFLAF